MGFRLLALILSVGIWLTGCGPGDSSSTGGGSALLSDRAATDSKPTDSDKSETPPLPPPPPAPVKAEASKALPVEPSTPSQPARAAAEPAPQVEEARAPSPLLTVGRLKTDLPEYRIPEKLRERIAKFQPDLLPAKPPEFTISQQHLTIDAKQKTVSFSGVLQVKNQKDLAFELACKIDTSEVPWVCRDMLPTDPKLAAERRIQGTFKCLDAYVCESVGVALWVVIDGKLQEPKLFQANGFQIRAATSGDEDEDEAEPPVSKLPPKMQDRVPSDPNGKSEKAPREKKQEPLAVPLPKPRPVITVPATPQMPLPDDEELERLLDDPDGAVEISEPMTMPQPKSGKYSVPGLERLKPDLGPGVKVQAMGWHHRGSLQKAAEFPAAGAGFVSRDHGTKDFATDMTVQLLTDAFAVLEKKYPGRPAIILGSVANRTGGRLLNLSGHAHASHQTGLDADVGFPATVRVASFFNACGSTGCGPGRGLSQQFDIERFWLFTKQLACAEQNPVLAMFLDRNIKRQVCRYVRETAHENMSDPCVAHALQVLYHQAGHDDHVHVRLRCPEHSACQNTFVTLPSGSGC